MGRFIFRLLMAIMIAGFIGIQYIEVERTNPPVKDDIEAPLQIKNILKNACYDCHSNETKWPWYSKVAPVSWLIIDDVNEGRKHLNFSEWENLYSRKKDDLKKSIWKELAENEMPPGKYIYLHPGASLEMTQKNVLKRWLQSSN